MKTFSLVFSFIIAAFCIASNSTAQESHTEFGYNVQSLRPIHADNQLFRKTLWYRIDLKEKQNKPLMAKENEITKVIIEAVKAGILRPYVNDSLATRMSYEQFLQNLALPGAGTDEDEIFNTDDTDWGGAWDTNDKTEDNTAATPVSNEYFPKDLKIMELKEDLVFDRKRGRMYHDIQALTIYLPAEMNPTGMEKAIASFSYKELVENVFRDNPQAVWFNNANPKESRNLEEAFELRLFACHLTKYANYDDALIEDIYGTGKGMIVASMQLEHSLLEYEVNMWEN